jgi:hypothetical protein
MTKNMRSEVSSYQQGQLIEKEDQKSILMIGGIKLFMPYSPVEASVCVSNVATAEIQLVVTVMMKEKMSGDTQEEEEMGQTSEPDPAEEEENSTEMLKIFNQEAEQGITTALEVVAEEEHVDKMLTPWEMDLEMLEDWLKHPKPVDDCHEKTVVKILEKEHSEKLLENFIQGAEQMMTVVLRSIAKGESEFQSEE